MDDLLREFLTETSESLDTVDNQLVRFEQEPNNAKILDNIFRLVHTIKGTCGFLGLPRLEALAHAAETLMGKFRDGMPVTGEAVSLILSRSTASRTFSAELEATEAEPEGNDQDLIGELEHGRAWHGGDVSTAAPSRRPPPAVAAPRRSQQGTLVPQMLERPLRPGEVSLDELERAFRETAIEVRAVTQPRRTGRRRAASRPPQPRPQRRKRQSRRAKPRQQGGRRRVDVPEADKVANQSIRVNVDTLEHLMTMVSELVLTRNQLLEISRRNEDTEFKVPLQRLSNVTAELQEGVMKTRMQPIGNAWQKLPRIVRDLVGRTRQADRTGDARRRHRARPPGARPDQGSADPHGAQLRRPWPGDPGRARWPPASPSRAPSGCPPITKAATSSSASPTTAAGSTPSGSRPRRSPAVSSARPNWRR